MLFENKSDQLIYPGEFVAIKGDRLSDAEVTIDGVPIPTFYHEQKSLLLRLPTGLNPVREHKLTVSNNFGSDSINFYSRHFIAATDTDNNQLHFMRTAPEEKGYIEMETAYDMTLDQKRALVSQISPSGGFLYSFGVESKKVNSSSITGFSYQVSMNLIHLAAYKKPELHSEFHVDLHSQPVAVTMSENNQIILLGAKDAAIIDISEEIKPRQVVRFNLAEATQKYHYMDVITLQQGQLLAVLETYGNKIIIYDISEASNPKQKSSYEVYPNVDLPIAVDLEIDPNNPDRFWVLSGPNLRALASNALTEVQRLFAEPTEGTVELPRELTQLSLTDTGVIESDKVRLPESFVPFYAKFGPNDTLFVTGLNGDLINSDNLELDLSLLKKLLTNVFSATQFGQVLEVKPDSKKVKAHAKGLGLYYHLEYMPELGPVFSLYKLGGTVFAPYVNVKWGVGVKSRGTFAIRKAHYKSIFPPYAVGYVSVQL
ncbi:hypothetical protein GCM10025776_17530 [Corallincola platygyrae]